MFPEEFGIIPEQNDITFANNDIPFKDKTGIDHDKFSFGLKKSLFNFMHGICFDYQLQEWFDFKIPNTTVSPDFINDSLAKEVNFTTKSSAKIVWIGGKPITKLFTKSKKGNSWEMMQLIFHDKQDVLEISLEKDKAEWLVKTLNAISVFNDGTKTYSQIKFDFENHFDDFELFWFSKPMQLLKNKGLLVF